MIDDFNTLEDGFQIREASLIVDKAGRVIALSERVKSLFPQLRPHQNFFEYFDDEKKSFLEKLFLYVKKNENSVKDEIEIKLRDLLKKLTISISPLKSENNIYFLISFAEANDEGQQTEVKNFRLTSANLKEVSSDEQLSKIIEKIKLSFPFSFIEKAKIQKEINELPFFFWLKDAEGKFVIVNEKFAEVSGFNSSQLENKNQSEVLSKYLVDIFQSLDGYIKSSNNPIIIDNLSSTISGGVFKDISIVELPLSDLDNNVVAIIGFSKPKEQIIQTEKNNLFEEELFKNIPTAVCFINNKNRIVFYTKEFLKVFSLGEKVDLTNESAEKIFEKEIIKQIEQYKSSDEKTAHSFQFNFTEKSKIKVEITLAKIDYNDEQLIQITIKEIDEKNLQVEKKALMYDALIELTPEPMFIYDLENLKFLEVNEQALKLYGYKRSEFLNMDLTDLYAPEDIQTLIETSENKSLSKSYSGPWRHKKSDGNSVFVELRRSSIEFNGRKAHLNLVRNVSDQIENKKKQQLLEMVYENTSDILIVTDKDGFIKEVNEPCVKKLGYPKRELENSSFISLLSDEKRAEINKNVFHSALPKSYSTEIEIKKLESGLQKANLLAFPIKNYSGDVESYCFIIKLIEEEVQKDLKQTQVEDTEKIDAAFLSNMFHEILTPLNVILGFAQELGESIENPNEDQKEAIEIIKENQKMLLQIMDNAVEYSQLEQKVIKFRTEEIKFVDILNELKELTRKTAEAKRVEIQYGKISSSLTLETDKQKFIYLLSLFLKFAIQITKEKSIYISASIYDDNYCAIGVKDKADGITAFLLKALSEVFTDDDYSTRRNYGFSRFSTMLAKKLVNLLSVRKANLSVGAEVKEFALVFPLKFVVAEKINAQVEVVQPDQKASKKKVTVVPTLETAEPEKPKKQIDFDLSNYSCLYLEDQIDSQVLFKVQMKDLKNIEFAVSFESAIPLLKAKKFDFILMDINLQGEYNGLDALRIIQKMPGYKNVPIIATTAYVQPGARERFISAGFSDYLPKPLLREKIIESLQNLLQ